MTISTGSTVTVQNSHHHAEGTITNNGTLALHSAGNFTDLDISGTVIDTPAAARSRCPTRRQPHPAASSTLTNDASNTIQGAGSIGGGTFTLNNKGTIDANVPAP